MKRIIVATLMAAGLAATACSKSAPAVTMPAATSVPEITATSTAVPPTVTPEPTATEVPPTATPDIEVWRVGLHDDVEVVRQACARHSDAEESCLPTVKYAQQALLSAPEGEPACVAGARYVLMLGLQDIAWDLAGAVVGAEHMTLDEFYASIDQLDTSIDEVVDEDCGLGAYADDTPTP